MSGWARRLAAFPELNLGLVYTPCLVLRSFLRPGSPIRKARVRRRIWLELGLVALSWTVALALIARWQNQQVQALSLKLPQSGMEAD